MVKPLIGIDGSRLSRADKTGTETYSDALIRGLVQSDSAQWRVYVDTELDRSGWPSRVDIRKLSAPRLWTHGRLSLEMATNAPGLLLVPAHVIPLIHPRAVVTIHDLGYLHLPDHHPARQRRMLDITSRWSARTAAAIIVPSHVTRQDLIERYNTPQNTIHVIPHGVDARFRDVAAAERLKVRDVYGLDRPYLLAVGTIHPRKNLPTLARATASLVASGHDLDLVLVGRDGWMADKVHQELHESGAGGRIRSLAYVPSTDLPALYAGAACFVQPSLFEGFGMPVVEAMAAGVPVVCARRAALPEIAGNGAEYFEPLDATELTSVIERILSHADHRRRLIERGLARSRTFSWERCVSQTLALLHLTLDG